MILSQSVGDHSRLSQRRGLRYFALLLKVKERRSAELLAFIRPVDYTAVIFFTYLVAVKCQVFTTTVTSSIITTITDRFYIALFSALEQTHCLRSHVILHE